MAGFLGLTTRFFAKVKSNFIFEPLREWLVGKASINKEVPEEKNLGQGDTSKEASIASPRHEGQEVSRRWLREEWQRSPRLNRIEDYFEHEKIYCREGSTRNDFPAGSIELKTSSAAHSPEQKAIIGNLASDTSSAAPQISMQPSLSSSDEAESCEEPYLSMHQKEAFGRSKRPRQKSHRKRVRRGRIFRRRRALLNDRRRTQLPKHHSATWRQLPPLPPPLAPWAKPIVALLQAHLGYLGEIPGNLGPVFWCGAYYILSNLYDFVP
jgi:hypothetical protein